MDNALINAAQGLLLSEKRILMLAITKLVKHEQLNCECKIILEAVEFSELFLIEQNTAYEQIKDACQSIIKKQVVWHEHGKKGLEKIEINWVSEARYSKGMGLVEISFTPRIQKYLTKLTKHFTTYKLQHASALRSVYSWRLLELLIQFKKTKWREIDLKDFSLAMEATNNQKKNFNTIKRQIIEPAIKELEKKGDWEINWNPIKTGKKVTSLRFDFKKKT